MGNFWIWEIVLSFVALMATEWKRRREYDDLETDEDAPPPAPILRWSYALWQKIAPMYERISWRAYPCTRILAYLIPRGLRQSNDDWAEWNRGLMSPEEELLAVIEWGMDPAYEAIRQTWANYLKTHEAAKDEGKNV